VQALGVDLMNGTVNGVNSFRDLTGSTFPLLMNGASTSGGNVSSLYGPRDNYVVLNKQGIVRYHAALLWPFGGRYRVDELRGTIDSLLSAPVGVEPELPAIRGLALAAAPNPFRASATVELTLPASAASARVSVFDPGGRRIATLHDGPLDSGRAGFTWDGRGADGASVPPGVYLVAADIDGRRLLRRIVRMR